MHIGDADKNLKLVQLVFFNWSAHNFHLWKDIHTIEADNIVKLITDMIFVKCFTPAQFPKYWNLPEKKRVNRDISDS